MARRPGDQALEPGGTEHGLIVRIGRGRGPDPAVPGADGWARKRTAIVEAATILFLERGYQGTSTEQIAAAASASKQTIYNHFGGKEQLFREIILGVGSVTAERFVEALPAVFAEITDTDQLDAALNALARRYLATVTSPKLLALRRLIIGEAHRFPDLAHDYYKRAPAFTYAALAAGFADLTRRGILHTPDPDIAAEHFADLVVGRSLDRGMFTIDSNGLADDHIERLSAHGVRAFLAAYGRATSSRDGTKTDAKPGGDT